MHYIIHRVNGNCYAQMKFVRNRDSFIQMRDA